MDFLGTRPFVDKNRIGVIGICGSGSFVISAAKIDPWMKAIATVSMYDMGAANRNGLRHSTTLEQRKKVIAEAAEQRYVEFTGGETKYTSGTVHELNRPLAKVFFAFLWEKGLMLKGKGKYQTFPPFPFPFPRLLQEV
ncbi:MAG: hypothetical protein RM338_15620 [Nostoc sp. DedQUE12a]|nr:hypothetical protein [Nostoc sp. DedQUE12a]